MVLKVVVMAWKVVMVHHGRLLIRAGLGVAVGRFNVWWQVLGRIRPGSFSSCTILNLRDNRD